MVGTVQSLWHLYQINLKNKKTCFLKKIRKHVFYFLSEDNKLKIESDASLSAGLVSLKLSPAR